MTRSNQQGVAHFGAKFGEEGAKVRSSRDIDCRMQKKSCRYLLSFDNAYVLVLISKID